MDFSNRFTKTAINTKSVVGGLCRHIICSIRRGILRYASLEPGSSVAKGGDLTLASIRFDWDTALVTELEDRWIM